MTCMPRPPTSLRDLITPALDAAEERARIRGERWSVRALESAHGIANGTLGAIAKGKRKAVDGATASRIAEAQRSPAQKKRSRGSGIDGGRSAPMK